MDPSLQSELDGPPFPMYLAHIWQWFSELHAARSMGGMSANPITWPDVVAWAKMTGRKPNAFELQSIRRLDVTWFRIQYEQRKKRK